jgi:hypothetical protein
MLPPVIVTSTAEPSFVLDAIYTAGTSDKYADGSLRVLGSYAAPNVGQVPLAAGPTLPVSGFAWTWNYDATTKTSGGVKTACYAVPASGALNQQIIFIGVPSTVSVAGSTWKQFIDARSNQGVYAGAAKNSGLYQTFENPTPFNVGDFTGFAAVANLAPTAGITLLYMWESAEAVIVQLREAATSGAVTSTALGAFVDPLSTNLANAETDGRLYGVSVTGSIATVPAAWMSATSGGSPFSHGTSSGNAHFGTFTPGAGTVTTTTRAQTFAPTSAFTSRNGDLPQIPYQLVGSVSGAYIGQLRQLFVTRDSLTGIAWEAAGVTKGYLLAASTQTATDAMLMAY